MEHEYRENLVVYGKKLLETGLVQGTYGNLSVRRDERYGKGKSGNSCLGRFIETYF